MFGRESSSLRTTQSPLIDAIFSPTVRYQLVLIAGWMRGISHRVTTTDSDPPTDEPPSRIEAFERN
jgi:hypothetical protein